MDAFIYGIFATLGGLGLIILFVLYFATHWDHIEKFLSVLPRLASGVSHQAELLSVSSSIQADINLAMSGLEKEAPVLFTHGVRVEWITQGDDFAKTDEDAIVIRVRDTQDYDRAYVNSVIQLLKRCLMPEARRFLHGHVLQAIELVLADRFFENARFRTARAVYYSDYYDPLIEKNKSIAQTVDKLHQIEEKGIMTRVFLRECQVLPVSYGAHYKPSGMKFELDDFLAYLSLFIESLDSPDKPPVEFLFSRDHIKVGFAVLADFERIMELGAPFYQARTRRSIESGIRTIYILATGRLYIQHAHRLAKWLEDQRLVRSAIPMNFTQYSWKGAIQSMCILCDVRQDLVPPSVQQGRDPTLPSEAEVLAALAAEIEGIRTGEIRVVKVGIIKGRVQIAINSLHLDAGRALFHCIGLDGVHAKRLQQTLKQFVKFVSWSPDLLEFVKANLELFDVTTIQGIQLDPVEKTAVVFVSSTESAIQARGQWDIGLQIASVMTDYDVQVAVDPKARLLEAIRLTVPEVKSGAIKIECVAIATGIQAKVQVSSANLQNPARICGAHAKTIKEKLRIPEWVWFCELTRESHLDTLISSLFPLRREAIAVATFNAQDNSADVWVRTEDDSRSAVGPEGANVKTAASVMGLRRVHVHIKQA